MQADVPDDSLMREAIASLGPGAKDFTLDDLTAWIRQLEELCDSQDAALAPASFRTDISGSCRSTFPEPGKKQATTAQTTKLQTKAVKGYPPLPELHLEKVSSNKKNARGEAKLRLDVDCGPVLVLLTITDLDGATHTLHAVTADDNALVPIKHPGTHIEATVIPLAPDELLERLRHVEAKVKQQKRDEHNQPSASAERHVEKASAHRQADGAKYMKKKVDGQVLDCAFDPEKGTVTMKATGCPNPYCDDVNCPGEPVTYTLNVKTREIAIEMTDDKPLDDVVATLLKSFQENPLRQLELSKRVVAVLKEEKAIHEKLSTAKPAEKKRLLKELDKTNTEYAKLNDLMFRTAGTGGWLGVPEKERLALLEKAKQTDPERVEALVCRAQAAVDEYNEIKAELESTASQTKEKRLSKLLGRKEIEFDEAMNDIAVIATSDAAFDSEREDGEELDDVFIRIACKALVAFDEYLPKLLERKEIEVDEATNDIAVIADGSEQKDARS